MLGIGEPVARHEQAGPEHLARLPFDEREEALGEVVVRMLPEEGLERMRLHRGEQSRRQRRELGDLGAAERLMIRSSGNSRRSGIHETSVR